MGYFVLGQISERLGYHNGEIDLRMEGYCVLVFGAVLVKIRMVDEVHQKVVFISVVFL